MGSRADLQLYRFTTGVSLQSVLDDIMQLEQSYSVTPASIDDMYFRVLYCVIYCALDLILLYHIVQIVFKFWWNQELVTYSILKADLIKACQIWKAAGRPRSGTVQLQSAER